MSIMGWLTGKSEPSKSVGGIKLINPGRSGADVRVVGGRGYSVHIPAYCGEVVRLPAGRYSVRFQAEDGFEIYQAESFTVCGGKVEAFTLEASASSGHRVRPVNGPL